MSLWQDVITTALIGTERRSLSLNPPIDPLGSLLCHLNQSDLEGTLLSAAAAIALYQKVGQLPHKDNNQSLSEPCSPEELPSCSTRAGQHLKLMLLKEREKLLPEWLAAVAKAGKRAPTQGLPELLELGRNSRQLRQAILPVLGKRGLWLAAQNPNWNYVVEEDIEKTWTTGSCNARQLLLHQLRAKDPATARERVTSVWEQEKSEERLGFIETFQTGLSIEDEPFLEAALDDRRKEVRQKAAELLAQLPESRLCQRMMQRVRSAISVREKRNRLHIDFTLPDANDEQLIRDGVDTKQPPRLLGEQSWRILQLVAATPLSLWSSIKRESPSEWIQAAKRSEWDRTLVEGWAVAALRQKNVDWAEALLAVYGSFNSYLISQDKLIQGLIGILSPEQRDDFLLKVWQSSNAPFDSKHPAFPLLCQYRYPWNTKLSRVVTEGIRRYLSNHKNSYDWSLRLALKDFACYIAPSLAPELLASLSAVVPPESSGASFWAEAIDEFLALLHFRQEMLQALED